MTDTRVTEEMVERALTAWNDKSNEIHIGDETIAWPEDFSAEQREQARQCLRAAITAALQGEAEPVSEPSVARDVHEALLDSQFRAGAGAGWNAAMHPDPAESERLFAALRRSEPGALAPILKRRKAEAPEHAPVSEPEPVAWERRPDGATSWTAVFLEDVEHYRRMGQEVRALYTHPPTNEAQIRADERERCAKIAEAFGRKYPDDPECADFHLAADDIATAIRDGGKP